MPIIIDVNTETGEVIEREMNEAELKEFQNDSKLSNARNSAIQKEVEEKAALLERLGITDEEAKLLLK